MHVGISWQCDTLKADGELLICPLVGMGSLQPGGWDAQAGSARVSEQFSIASYACD